MKKKILKNNIVIYQAKSGALELRKDVQGKTIWATQAEMALLYGKDQSVISRHIASIFSDGEVDKKRNMQEMHIANSDKPVVLYSLDIVLAVGYRTNSQRAIEFRQWATKTLRQYIVEGYAINKQRIAKNYGQFLEAVESVKRLLPRARRSIRIRMVFAAGKRFGCGAHDPAGAHRTYYPRGIERSKR
jgi:hypothetical protein